jgi:hypothetical protein
VFQICKNIKEKKYYSQLYKSSNTPVKTQPATKDTAKLPIKDPGMKYKPYSWNTVDDYWIERDQWTSKDSIIFRKWGSIGLKLAEDHMKALNKLCINYNIPMTIVVYPWKKQIWDGDLNCIQVRFWKQFCIANNIQFINLFPLFINNTPAYEIVEKYFVSGDNHWNEKGHQLVGDFLYKEFEKSWSIHQSN